MTLFHLLKTKRPASSTKAPLRRDNRRTTLDIDIARAMRDLRTYSDGRRSGVIQPRTVTFRGVSVHHLRHVAAFQTMVDEAKRIGFIVVVTQNPYDVTVRLTVNLDWLRRARAEAVA